MNRFILTSLFLLISVASVAQHKVDIHASLNALEKTMAIQQTVVYKNESKDTLHQIYFHDWINSFRNKNIPLAKRFAEDYIRNFHYAKDDERGKTEIHTITNSTNKTIDWKRPDQHPDILYISLENPLSPGESVELHLNYSLHIPDHKFTRYGYHNGNFKLRYWAILPGVYNGNWNTYSHKNLDDQFVSKIDMTLNLDFPSEYSIVSPLQTAEETINLPRKKIKLTGENVIDTKLYFLKNNFFEGFPTKTTLIYTDIEDEGIRPEIKISTLHRIAGFLQDRLGDYPHKKLVVTQEDYLSNPVYGLNQLPSFIRPFPDGFQYDIKLMKTITNTYLANTVLLNPREEKWVHDAIHISLMIDYVNTYYPEVKLLGTLSNFIGIRWFHAADLQFNDQYPYLFMNMARLNLDQALTTEQDSLVKFNKNIASPYKAGVGLSYLADFIGKEPVEKSIKEFYESYNLQPVHPENFEQILKKNSTKNIDWFFEEYVGSNKRIDFKISTVEKTTDSLRVTIKNKENNHMPVSLYGLKDKKIVSKHWVETIEGEKTFTIPRKNINRLALNYKGIIPEFNQRNNYHRVTKIIHKPIQFRLLNDVEDPRYTQFFVIPEFSYNLYDGVTIGPKLYNKTFLRRNFTYKIAPKIGFGSGALVGSASIINSHQYKNQRLHLVQYGISGSRYSYAQNLYYHRFTPFVNIYFRNPYLRDNENQSIGIRNVSVMRDRSIENPVDEPDYNVLNFQYNYNNRNFDDYFTASFDYQIAKKFSKISITSKWRKLFLNNRQLEFRLFAGTFLFHNNRDSDYFSFALDRPTDYMFDHNYYGRSEASGLFSQQFIEAEGGFKSKLQPAYANQWMTTLNGSFTLWNWIHAYGDAGFVKNRYESPEFVYDSGIRASLVQDYFEVFFPLYSSLGWEPSQANYDQKIRFIVTLDINTLIKLFTRRWY